MIRTSLLLSLVLGAVPILAAEVRGDPMPSPTPIMKLVQPNPVKAGTGITVTGMHLGKQFVAAVYLTQGDESVKLDITLQENNQINVVIPANTKPGRFGLMVLTTGDQSRLLDEPVLVSIEAQ